MIDLRIKEKIQALKAKYIDGDDSAKRQIREWETEIMRLSMISDFVSLAPVQYIVKVLKERIKKILIEKAAKGTSVELDASEKELRYCLSLFVPRYESELETIEQIIDAELI